MNTSEPLVARYLTDDRDHHVDDQRELRIQQGGNGDWYVFVARVNERFSRGVRICTSGGAATQAPGLPAAIAAAYRSILKDDAPSTGLPSYDELLQEVMAWRLAAPHAHYCESSGSIIRN